MMASFQAKEAEISAFLKKCDELIQKRASIPNFDEVADQYLEEGERIEDEIDNMIKSKTYPQDQQKMLDKFKADVSKVLDQLENVDAPPSPSKSQMVTQPQATPVPAPIVPPAIASSTPAPVNVGPPVAASTPAPAPATVTALPPVAPQQQVPTLALNGNSPRLAPPPAASFPLPMQAAVQFQQLVNQTTIQNGGPPTPRTLANLKYKSGNEIWQIVKSDKQSTNEQVFEALKTLGAIPNGFRASFLQNIISATNDLYTFTNFLAPKATPHCLSFKDAAFGSGVGKILHHGTAEPRFLRILTITACINMLGLHGTNITEIMDRIIRVCLVDGERIISNIYTIRVSGTSDPEKRNWIFDTAVNDFSLGMHFGEMFLKCDSKSNNVSILFECAYVVKRAGSNDACMISCGWYLQPLVENNEPIRKGNFEGLLYGGMPMEFNVSLGAGNPQPQPAQRPKKQVSLKNSKEPFIMFKLAEFNLERELVDTVPDTLIGCTLHLQAFDFYCDSLISLLGKREHPQWAGRIHNPFLSTFPSVADQPDIMDVVRILWMETFKKLTRQERKDDQVVRTKFISTYLSIVIPALGSVVLGRKFEWLKTLSDPRQMELRRQELGAMIDVLRQNKSPFQLVNISFRPVQPDEYLLDLMSPNSFTLVS